MSALDFYAHGKVLLTGEYFVLDGAAALALPSKLGQRMRVDINQDSIDEPILEWTAYEKGNEIWNETSIDMNSLSNSSDDEFSHTLINILRQARILNPDFLMEKHDIKVTTHLEFDPFWGLGSSSTLISMIAQWANILDFDLLKHTFGGSGYDIACAKAAQPIIYSKSDNKPEWQKSEFNPSFADNLYFVYLNQKQNSRDGINLYKTQKFDLQSSIDAISELTKQIENTDDLVTFETLIQKHENIIADTLNLPKVKDTNFNDYWGIIKSLGAWGGDFILVTSNKDKKQTYDYFSHKGYETVFNYRELIL